ncbi:MAG TPA: DNA adenine methylase [Allosphingosinicella sp.]|nr:DNA adenine methylase [Allosphingosinicella sp.]
MTAPTRPLLRWHGGKWRLAPWIIAHFPPHRAYVEPYGGGGSVLLRKPRAHAELWNDLDDEVVTLFRVLRDRRQAAELCRLLSLTPFARKEFVAAYTPADEPLERCRRLIIRSFMGQGSVSNERIAGATGFRNNLSRSTTSPMSSIPAHDWAGYPTSLRAVIERLDRVNIESRDALELMHQHDAADVLFYCDPPYLPETRSRVGNRKGGGYVAYLYEMTDEDHAELLAFLRTLKGMVVLSGYPSALYDQALPDWRRVERAALADGARPRTEVLWINPLAAERLAHGPLFASAA